MEAATQDVTEIAPRYFIDTAWYDEHNRSFRAVAQSRLCESCKEKLGTETQERVPAIDPRTGRVVYEVRSVPYAENPMSVIRTCCAKKRDYITSETPIAEAIFRVFLASGNQPMSVERIREELGTYVSMGERPHNYGLELIERVIKADRYYGLRQFQLGQE